MTEDSAPVATPPVAMPAITTPITTEATRAIVGSAPASRRRIGPSDLHVFPIALSGNVFGWTAGAAESERVLDAYVAHGGNFVDTADSYAGGRSEIILGNWLRSRGARDDIVLATKV